MACQTRVTPASRKQNKLKKTDLISVRAASALMTSARVSPDEHGATAIEDFSGLIACYESRDFDTDGHIFDTLVRHIDDVRDFPTESLPL
jgi:hypothetical protein